MPSASIGIELISEPFLIPIWFYVYSAIAYAVSALISVCVAYFSYKFFRMSEKKPIALLMLSFIFLTLAFSTLTFASVYTYFYKPYFEKNFNLGSLSFVNSVSFNIHYITSIVAYISLLVMYLSQDLSKLGKILKNKIPVLYIPLWYLNFMDFHIASILILLYVVFRNVFNFLRKRDMDNFLVMLAFVLMLSSHMCLQLIEFDPTVYIAANTLLAAGFSALLIMLIRVSRIGRKIREGRKTRKKV